MKFEISDEDYQRIRDWQTQEVYPEVIAEQRAAADRPAPAFAETCWDNGYPYSGATGGDLTFKFTPTSLGLVTIVECWGRELNLTNYKDW